MRYFWQWPHHEPQREEAKGCERENHRHVCLPKYMVVRPVILHNLDYEHRNGILYTDVNNANAVPKDAKDNGRVIKRFFHQT